MDENREERHTVSPISEGPRAWVFSLEPRDNGRPLYRPQTIAMAVRDLLFNPSVGIVVVRIPGMANIEILGTHDISVIGSRKGLIITGPAPKTNGAIETVLLLQEKLLRLEKANEETPGIFRQVLNIQNESRYRDFAFKFRNLRNRIAHPTPFKIFGGGSGLFTSA